MTDIIIIVPATRRTNLSAVSSCSTESGCCFCQSSRETRSYSMLMTRPRPPRCEDPLQSLAAITIRTLHLSQSWPRSHDLLSPVLCSLVCSCTLPLRIRTLRVSKHRSLVPTLGLSPAFPIPGGHSSRQRSLSKLSEADNIREAFWEISCHLIGHWSHKDISLVTGSHITFVVLKQS